MRNSGLDQAIHAAGGVGALARKIGISQPSLSNWQRVPPERVLAVESATGIDRAMLRPDLYGGTDPDAVDETDAAALRADSSPLGVAHAALGSAAATATIESVEHEFFELFIGIGRGELVPYASYYITGFLNERPLARLRDDLAQLGIERVTTEVEPEDHAAVLCEIMAGLAGRRFDAPEGADRALFEKHLAPWIGRFFTDIEHAKAADFYRRVGALGRVFMDIESEAFTLAS
jgi:TorA maturation chaperone TorD